MQNNHTLETYPFDGVCKRIILSKDAKEPPRASASPFSSSALSQALGTCETQRPEDHPIDVTNLTVAADLSTSILIFYSSLLWGEHKKSIEGGKNVGRPVIITISALTRVLDS